MNGYLKPLVESFTKQELEKKIKAYASGCSYALCTQGSTYTCNKAKDYGCDNYSNGSNPCPSGYSFTCTSSVNHVDAIPNVSI